MFPAISRDLRRGFLVWMAIVLVLSSAAFGTLFLVLYRHQLGQERERALLEMNRLLQSSLENAMLKADLDGLRTIIDRLGAQPGMRGAMILDPDRRIRFASDASLLGRTATPAELGLCAACTQTPVREIEATSVMLPGPAGDTLRSVSPVANQPQCGGCHGPASARPVNGLLVVDYDASRLQDAARQTAALFILAGAAVMLLVLGSGWWFIQRRVLHPVQALASTSQALSQGRFDARVQVHGQDELAQLGRTFNDMAGSLQSSVQALQARKAFLQSLVDAVPDAIRVIDRNHAIVLVNAAFERMHGLRAGAAVGSQCYRMSHRRDTPCPASLHACPLQEVRSRDSAPVRLVTRHARDDSGAPRDVEVFAAPLVLPGSDGEEPAVIEAIRDLEQDVRYSHEQRLSELGRLATGVAHEIHNPLASIRIALQAARRSVGRADFDVQEVGDYLSMVDGQIDRCVEVTERLLNLSMPSGKPQLVNINRPVHETLALLKWEAQTRGIAIDERLSDSITPVFAPDGDLRMVTLNLAQNAFHAMPAGGRLVIETGSDATSVFLRVRDDGVGIAAADLPRIFEPFFSRRADGRRGTGLGLSICRSLIEAANGDIAVVSAPGAGACFTVTLPAASEVVSTL